MKLTKETLLKLTEESIQAFEFEQLTDIVLTSIVEKIVIRLSEDFSESSIKDFMRLIQEDLYQNVQLTVKDKYEPYKFKHLISEHVIDGFLCQEFQLSYETDAKGFREIIQNIENMKEKHVPKKAYLKSLRKWIKDSHVLDSSDKIKLLDKIDKKILN